MINWLRKRHRSGLRRPSPGLRAAALTLKCFLVALVLACVDDLPGTRPPDDVLYFPLGLQIAEGDRFAYVTNSNFDLRFSSGWMSVVDLEEAVGEAQCPGGRVVGSESPGIVVDQLRIPSLGGAIAANEPGGFLYVAHRSERLISVIETRRRGGVPTINCGDPGSNDGLSVLERRTECDRAHLFQIRPDAAEDVSESDTVLTNTDVSDPFGLRVQRVTTEFGEQPYLVAGQLSRARLNAFEIAEDGPPFLRFGRVPDELSSAERRALDPDADGLWGRSERFFFDDPSIRSGRVNKVVEVPGTERPFLAVVGFVASQRQPQRGSILHLQLDDFVTREAPFSRLYLPSNEVGGIEFADLVFSPDGRFAYTAARLVNRLNQGSARSSIIRLDATFESIEFINGRGERDITMQPRYAVDGQTALRGQPSSMVYLARESGDLLAVADLDQDTVFFLDPTSAELPVVGRLDVAGGPFSLAMAEINGREVLVMTLFYNHEIVVVDIGTPDPVSFCVVSRIANERLSPAERTR